MKFIPTADYSRYLEFFLQDHESSVGIKRILARIVTCDTRSISRSLALILAKYPACQQDSTIYDLLHGITYIVRIAPAETRQNIISELDGILTALYDSLTHDIHKNFKELALITSIYQMTGKTLKGHDGIVDFLERALGNDNQSASQKTTEELLALINIAHSLKDDKIHAFCASHIVAKLKACQDDVPSRLQRAVVLFANTEAVDVSSFLKDILHAFDLPGNESSILDLIDSIVDEWNGAFPNVLTSCLSLFEKNENYISQADSAEYLKCLKVIHNLIDKKPNLDIKNFITVKTFKFLVQGLESPKPEIRGISRYAAIRLSYSIVRPSSKYLQTL
jgi:hypothetical protein